MKKSAARGVPETALLGGLGTGAVEILAPSLGVFQNPVFEHGIRESGRRVGWVRAEEPVVGSRLTGGET